MDKKFLADRKKAVKEIATAADAIKLHLKYIERLADQYGICVELELPATGYDGSVYYKPRPPQELEDIRDDPDSEDIPDISDTDWEWAFSAEEDARGEQFGWKNSSSYC